MIQTNKYSWQKHQEMTPLIQVLYEEKKVWELLQSPIFTKTWALLDFEEMGKNLQSLIAGILSGLITHTPVTI